MSTLPACRSPWNRPWMSVVSSTPWMASRSSAPPSIASPWVAARGRRGRRARAPSPGRARSPCRAIGPGHVQRSRRRRPRRAAPSLDDVPRLEAEVELLQRELGEQLDEAGEVRRAQRRRAGGGRPRRPGPASRCRGEAGPQAGALDLDHDAVPSASRARWTWPIEPAAKGSGSSRGQRAPAGPSRGLSTASAPRRGAAAGPRRGTRRRRRPTRRAAVRARWR